MRWKIGAIGALLLMTTAAIQVAGFSDDNAGTDAIAFHGGVDEQATGANEQAMADNPVGTDRVHLQEDAFIPGDAPDSCADLERDRVVPDDDTEVPAQLFGSFDETDVFLATTSNSIGGRANLSVVLDDVALNLQQIEFDVLTADCSESVLDTSSSYYDSISPEPGEGEKIVYSDWDARTCVVSKDYWKFHVSDAEYVQEIFIEWTNGAWERRSFVDGNAGTGNYISNANIEYDIRSAEVIVKEEWDGNFDLIQRPCDTVDGGAEPVKRKPGDPIIGDNWVTWDVTDLEYILVVTLAHDATDDVPAAAATSGLATRSAAATCHWEGCRETMEKVSYASKLGSDNIDAG